MKYLYLIVLSLTTFSIQAQQWVIDDIAEEQKTSESIPWGLIILLGIVGYFVFKHIQKKDEEDANRRAKERRMGKKQLLEEELREYRERLEDDLNTLQVDNNIIVPNIPKKQVIDTPKVTPINSIEEPKYIETDKYTLSLDGKEFIKAKDCDNIIIPNSVEVIKFEAFMGQRINSITNPHSVKTIESLAFSGCSVDRITIPNSIERFGELIFNRCDNLKEVVFEDGLKTIGESMFYRCYNLETVILPNTIISIPDSAFDTCISLTITSLPTNLIRIGDTAFCSCKKLKLMDIPSTTNDIGRWAFRNCTFSSIEIPDSVYGIPEYAFAENTNLKKVYLPNTITCIMSKAFYGCENLQLRIPPSVTYIAPDAFEQCNEYRYDNIRIEVPKGKKGLLESICKYLKGKVYEYEVTDDVTLPSNLALQKKRFIDYQIFKEKEDLRNSEPMFYCGAQVVFKYTNNCTYDNFEGSSQDENERDEEKETIGLIDSVTKNETQIPISSNNSLDFSSLQVTNEEYVRNREKQHKEFINKFIKKQEDKFFPSGSIEDKLQFVSRERTVDLGLSVKWCSKNIGAVEIYDLGYHFRWGSLDYVEDYDKETVVKYYEMPYDDYLEKLDKDISGDVKYDAAVKFSNGECRTPTMSECEELIEKCDWEYIEVDRYKGFIITGPSGKSIYLPLYYSSFVNCMNIVMMTVEEAYMTSTPDMTPRPDLEEVWGFEGYTYKLKIINNAHSTETFTRRIDCFGKKTLSPIRGVCNV